MRSFILMALVALFALSTAMPISPSAPRFQKRAEQYRLQGLQEVCHAHPHLHDDDDDEHVKADYY